MNFSEGLAISTDLQEILAAVIRAALTDEALARDFLSGVYSRSSAFRQPESLRYLSKILILPR